MPRSGKDTEEHVSAPPAPLPSGARTKLCRTCPQRSRGYACIPTRCWGCPTRCCTPCAHSAAPHGRSRGNPLVAAAVGNEREKKQPLRKRIIMQSMSSQIKTPTDIITSPGWLRKTPRPALEDEVGSPGAPPHPPMRRKARSDLEARSNASRSLFADQQQEPQAQPQLAQPSQAGSVPAPANGSPGTSADSSAAPSSPTPRSPMSSTSILPADPVPA